MIIINYLKDNWTLLSFLCVVVLFILNWIKATKCSLRNDILSIYDQCKTNKQITMYQKEAIHLSYDLYKKLHGNSFVEEVVKTIDTFQIVN